MIGRSSRNELLAICGVLLCFSARSGVLGAEDRAQTLIAKSRFTGGVAVHVQARTPRYCARCSNNVRICSATCWWPKTATPARPARRWWRRNCTARSASACGNRGRCHSSTTL